MLEEESKVMRLHRNSIYLYDVFGREISREQVAEFQLFIPGMAGHVV